MPSTAQRRFEEDMEKLFTVPVIMRSKKGFEAETKQYVVGGPEEFKEHLVKYNELDPEEATRSK